jgi:hypothetical protein
MHRGERHGGGGPPWPASQSDLRLAAPGDPGGASVGRNSRIEVIAGELTICLGTGFDSGDLRRVLQIVRELS